jgi:hypothetical protein
MKKVVMVIMILSVLFLASCTYVDPAFLEDYNNQVAILETLSGEHENLVNEINENTNNPSYNREKMQEYLDWVDLNEDTIYNFKSFIELNYMKIERGGQNPDYVRDNLVQLLLVIQQNELDFRKIIAEQEAQNAIA